MATDREILEEVRRLASDAQRELQDVLNTEPVDETQRARLQKAKEAFQAIGSIARLGSG